MVVVWYSVGSPKFPDVKSITRKINNKIKGLTAQTESDRVMYRTNKKIIDGDLVITSPDLEKSKKFWDDLTLQKGMR